MIGNINSINKLKSINNIKKFGLGTALMGFVGTSFAENYTEQIGAAVTDGTGNVTAVIAGVIAVAILGFGVGKMLGWFGR